jgi:hypothetical protein
MRVSLFAGMIRGRFCGSAKKRNTFSIGNGTQLLNSRWADIGSYDEISGTPRTKSTEK